MVRLNNFYTESISKNEYYNYSFGNLYVYVGDNYLNSFEKLLPLHLGIYRSYKIEILKESTEVKLPEPYNPCKEASVDKPNHLWNCIEACIYKEIATKHNCTIPFALFSFRGLKRCTIKYFDFKEEFRSGCLKKCPLESCFSEKFSLNLIEKGKEDVYAVFSFLLSDLSSLSITQISKTDRFTALNNIGGGLGLFMGIAFPNVIEFLQFIFETSFTAF
jgi:hypothetical protein